MQFQVENMTCGGCARSVTRAIEKLDPAAKIEADPSSRRVSVESSASAEAIIRVLDQAGFAAAPL